MDMSEVYLEDDEVAFVQEFEEPIHHQLDHIIATLVGWSGGAGPPNIVAYMIAELCIYHFTLGREFQRKAASNA